MNWGHGITLVIIAFLIGMLGMVYVAHQQTNEMVDDHYYEKELKYQNIIEAQKRLMALESGTLIKQDSTGFLIHLPLALVSKKVEGEIEMMRLNDQSKDKKIKLAVNENGIQYFDLNSFDKGEYKARVKMMAHGEEYYKEENVFVNK